MRAALALVVFVACTAAPGGEERSCATTEVCDGEVVIVGWQTCQSEEGLIGWREEWLDGCRDRVRGCAARQCSVSCDPNPGDPCVPTSP